MGEKAVPHLSDLAQRGYIIQIMNAFELRDALDASTDLRHDLGDTMDEDFPVLMIEKEISQSPYFHHCLDRDGIRWPVVVIIIDGKWQLDDGHNRLQFGLLNNLPVPVVIDDWAGEESVARDEIMQIMSESGDSLHDGEGPVGWDDTVIIDKRIIANLVPFPRTGEQAKISMEVG
jgi:hypothetical protein